MFFVVLVCLLGIVEEIYIAPEAGAEMVRHAEVEAVAGRGLVGDRYFLKTGRFSRGPLVEVTLIRAEALEKMATDFGVAVAEGQHRRNLVVRGVDLDALHGRRFSIGNQVVMEYGQPRPPCGYLERITEKGMTRAMGRGAGIGVKVIAGGVIREGDAVCLLPGVEVRRGLRLP